MVADAYKLTDPPKTVRLRRQRPEGPGGGAGLDAVQRPDGRLDPRQGRQAGAELRRPTSRASPSTRSSSTRPRRPAPPTTIGAAARRASARAWPPTCRPGRSAPPATTIPEQSKVVGKAGIMLAPPGKGMPKKYGVGGWGLAINADIDPKKQGSRLAVHQVDDQPRRPQGDEPAAAPAAISGSARPMTRISWRNIPSFRCSIETFVNGDGEYRPRIPQYPQIQDILGTAVNAVLVGNTDPKKALDDAQAKAAETVLRGKGLRALALAQCRQDLHARSDQSRSAASSCAGVTCFTGVAARSSSFSSALPALDLCAAGGGLAARPGHLSTASSTTACLSRRRAPSSASATIASCGPIRRRGTRCSSPPYFTVAAVAIEFVLGLGLALLLWRDSLFQRVCLALLLIPVTVTPLVVGLIFRALLAARLRHDRLLHRRPGACRARAASSAIPARALATLVGGRRLAMDAVHGADPARRPEVAADRYSRGGRGRRRHRRAALPHHHPADAPAGGLSRPGAAHDGCLPGLRHRLLDHQWRARRTRPTCS